MTKVEMWNKRCEELGIEQLKMKPVEWGDYPDIRGVPVPSEKFQLPDGTKIYCGNDPKDASAAACLTLACIVYDGFIEIDVYVMQVRTFFGINSDEVWRGLSDRAKITLCKAYDQEKL